MNRAIALVVPLALCAGACGESAIGPITGGEGNGNTGFAVLVTDDPANDPSPGPARVSPQAVEGSLVGSIRVSLRNAEDALVDLGLMQDAEVALQEGGDSLRLSDLSRPPADEYVGIQLRFEGVDVTVLAGSEVGDSTLTNNVVLDVGSGGLATIEIATQSFAIDSDTDLDIVVDLNSELWITGDNIDDTIVSQADLANAVTVEIP